jgi:hypothetical protein
VIEAFAVVINAPVMPGTRAERSERPKRIQPGNREWGTVIQEINAQGWCIPPFKHSLLKYVIRSSRH